MTDNSFQVKGGVVTTIILEIANDDIAAFEQLLIGKIEQAPQFFAQSPVLLQLQPGLEDSVALDTYVSVCRQYGLHPIGFKGQCTPGQQQAINALGLSVLNDNATRGGNPLPDLVAAKPEVQIETVVEQSIKEVVREKIVQRPTKVVKQPVRSGQQIYAQGADLVVLANVNEGAEVIADGNVHIYGALRGRALAGVQGDAAAQVFCQSMEAELVSIAGDFMLSDSIATDLHKLPVRVELVEQNLQLTRL